MISEDRTNSDLGIKIIGIGGAGTNVVDGLKLDNLEDVRLSAINTDAQALSSSPIAEKMVIGRTRTYGLGAGGEVYLGRDAAESDRDSISRLIEDMDLVILVAGLGGGTGSAASIVAAEVAAKLDKLTLAFVTLPFNFEGSRRMRIAEESLGELRKLVHGLIPLPNDVLLQEGEEDISVLSAFAVADHWIGRGINSICSMLLKTGLINQDFSSLRSVFQYRGGKTIFGTGTASGDNFVNAALDDLFLCPLLHLGDRPPHLDHLLVNVIGGADLSISKVNEIMTSVSKRFGSRDDIVFGAVIDESRHNSLEICVLGKTDMEHKKTEHRKKIPATENNDLLGEVDAITKVHKHFAKETGSSSRRSKKTRQPDQDEFDFIQSDAQRGCFDKTERNLYRDEDLDVPTYLRRGIKIKV